MFFKKEAEIRDIEEIDLLRRKIQIKHASSTCSEYMQCIYYYAKKTTHPCFHASQCWRSASLPPNTDFYYVLYIYVE